MRHFCPNVDQEKRFGLQIMSLRVNKDMLVVRARTPSPQAKPACQAAYRSFWTPMSSDKVCKS